MSITTPISMPVKRAGMKRSRHRTAIAAVATHGAEREPLVGMPRHKSATGGKADAAEVTGLRAVPRLVLILGVAAPQALAGPDRQRPVATSQ